ILLNSAFQCLSRSISALALILSAYCSLVVGADFCRFNSAGCFFSSFGSLAFASSIVAAMADSSLPRSSDFNFDGLLEWLPAVGVLLASYVTFALNFVRTNFSIQAGDQKKHSPVFSLASSAS